MNLQKKIILNKNLIDLNSLKLSVKSKYFIECSNDQDLKSVHAFLKNKKIKFFILGEGTNIVFKKNFDGLIIKNSYKTLKKINGNKIKISSGFNWDKFVQYCLNNSLYGVENLSGIPGSIGATPIQNIGAYGKEVSSLIESIEIFNLKTGKNEEFLKKDMFFKYRDSIFKNKSHLFIKNICFSLNKDFIPNTSYDDLKNKKFDNAIDVRKEILKIRKRKLENYKINPNVGSFYKNPIINEKKLKQILSIHDDLKFYKYKKDYKVSAAWLIDRCNWKGKQLKKSFVSKKHALVLVNKDSKSSSILGLSNKIKKEISNKYKIKLTEEPRII